MFLFQHFFAHLSYFTRLNSVYINMEAVVLLLVCINFISQSRPHPHCIPPIDCRMSAWSIWSKCSTSKCGRSGYQNRVRSIITHPCDGKACPTTFLETRVCYGATTVDCEYSTWSTWSTCTQCREFQAFTRYIIAKEQCGGTPCNMTALSKTRACKQTQCLNQGTLIDGQCSCLPGYYGGCCQYNNGKKNL